MMMSGRGKETITYDFLAGKVPAIDMGGATYPPAVGTTGGAGAGDATGEAVCKAAACWYAGGPNGGMEYRAGKEIADEDEGSEISAGALKLRHQHQYSTLHMQTSARRRLTQQLLAPL